MANSIVPNFKTIYYANNPETGYFTKTHFQPDITPLMKLPYELKIEPTQLHHIKTNAAKIIRGKEKFKSSKENYKFFTGLQETAHEGWYSGNDYEFKNGIKILSLILFNISKGNDFLTVYYFNRFYLNNSRERFKFIYNIIPELRLNTISFKEVFSNKTTEKQRRNNGV